MKNCFVIMPFQDPHNEYYSKIIKPAMVGKGYIVKRADEIYSNGSIIDDIYSQIIDADIIISDVSGKNPNVNYELGVAHALQKQVIIISKSVEDIPFDYKHIRTIVYNTESVNWSDKLITDLQKTVDETDLDSNSLLIKPLNSFYENLSNPNMKGFKRVFNTRQSMNIHIDSLWENKSKKLDILAFGLKSFRDSQRFALQEKLENGLKLRILTIDPSSTFLLQRKKDEGLLKGSISKTIYDLIGWCKKVNEDLSNNNEVSLKLYNSLPLDFYWRQDESIFVGPYLHGIGSQQTLTYEIDISSSVGDFYLNYYESLWNNQDFSYEYK